MTRSKPSSDVADRAGAPVVDAETLDAFLSSAGEDGSVLLFFRGDPAQRPEARDVAVIFPELLKAFEGRLRGGVVASGAEKTLGVRLGVDVLPAVALLRGGATIGVIPRIRDWAEYLEKIERFLDPAAKPAETTGRPRVEITYSHKGATA